MVRKSRFRTVLRFGRPLWLRPWTRAGRNCLSAWPLPTATACPPRTSVAVTVMDNGVEVAGAPEEAVTTASPGGDGVAVEADGERTDIHDPGGCGRTGQRECSVRPALRPDKLPDNQRRARFFQPRDSIFSPGPLRRGTPGSSTAKPMVGYDYGDYAEFNNDRTAVTISLTDGGPGDDDGLVNGVISDPSGLGSFDRTRPRPPPNRVSLRAPPSKNHPAVGAGDVFSLTWGIESRARKNKKAGPYSPAEEV